MNMIAPGMNVLATVESLSALDVFTGDAHEKLVTRLEEYVRAQEQDMTTPKGRDAIRSLAAKVARTKIGLDEMGKEHVAELKKQTGAVDAQRKLIRDRLDALRDEVRDPLTKFEEAEANRVAEHERLLVLLAGAAVFNTVPSLAEIDDRIAKLSPFIERQWEEFSERATEAYDDAINKLNGFRAGAVQQAADAAELVELRKKTAENEAREVAARFEAAKAENLRVAVAQQAERERLQAVARAEQAAQAELAARQAAEVAENQRLRALEQAERDAEAAAARAVEDERKRVAKVAADEAAAALKLERNKKHRAKIHNEIIAALEEIEPEPEALVAAIADGRIPHVSIQY